MQEKGKRNNPASENPGSLFRSQGTSSMLKKENRQLLAPPTTSSIGRSGLNESFGQGLRFLPNYSARHREAQETPAPGPARRLCSRAGYGENPSKPTLDLLQLRQHLNQRGSRGSLPGRGGENDSSVASNRTFSTRRILLSGSAQESEPVHSSDATADEPIASNILIIEILPNVCCVFARNLLVVKNLRKAPLVGDED